MNSKPFIRSLDIWGRMVSSFLRSKIVLFYDIIGEAFNTPCHIFSTPPVIGLRERVNI